MGYISKFWRGFFPILIIELETSSSASEHPPSSIEDGPGQSNEVRKENNSLKEANGFYVPFLFTHHLRKKAFLSGSVFFLRDPLFPTRESRVSRFPKFKAKMEQLDYYFPEGSRILEIPHIFTSVSLVKSKMAGFRFPKFRAKTLHPVSRIFP